ncbi:MAG: hypothetical protein KatS3mg105_4104 [Gemmatales bacterium]|nr:MAG: hypothetical protein KatS3mg105_4104 [Gemmatales bacterium]
MRFFVSTSTVVIVIGSLSWFLWSLHHGKSASSPKENAAQAEEQEQGGFAVDRVRDFDADRAMNYLKQICAIGPRISGSDGMKKQQQLLKRHFEKFGASVTLQPFTAVQTSRPKDRIPMANMVITWHPRATKRVIVCCHYDTRPIADQEPERRDWFKPFVSANDGGSGVALLMEFAHHIKNWKLNVGVDFVIFDGEEMIFDPETDKYFFGSQHFAREYRKNRPRHRYQAAVLLDMIAGKNPNFAVEMNSWIQAGQLVQELWQIAQREGCRSFRAVQGGQINDDHLALNAAGIPTVDIIDFNYMNTHWHRLSDTPENCSSATLAEVARVLEVWLKSLR